MLSITDRQDCRLVCKRWNELGRAADIQVQLPCTAAWEEVARTARSMCLNGKINVQLNSYRTFSECAELLQNPLCDVVSDPGVLPKWSLDFRRHNSLRAQEMARLLQALHQGLQGSTSSAKVQLNLTLFASHVRTVPGMKAAVASVASSITQLRVMKSLPDFTDNQLQLTHLKTLAFTLSSNTDKVSQCQTALLGLPSLQTLHIFTVSQASADCVCMFLQVLYNLPNVTNLLVGTGSKRCSVSAPSLKHVTTLQLGIDVCAETIPVKLVDLCLEGSLQCEQSYARMLKQAELAQMPLSVTLYSLQPVLLQHLPETLHSLSLVQPFEQQRDLLHTVLAQLPRSKLLQLGNFLTQDVVTLFTDLRFPLLHTFGFRVHCRDAPSFPHQIDCMYFECPATLQLLPYENDWPADCRYVLVPVVDLVPLSTAFPALQQMQVCFNFPTAFITAGLDCSGFNTGNFPRLRGVTCHCSNSWLLLRNLPSTCRGVVKSTTL